MFRQVDKKIAIKHEQVLEKGRQVHKVLEREVHPEEILVATETKADRWGLKSVSLPIFS
jgi:exonuclease V